MPDSAENSIGTSTSDWDTDGDGQFDGLEWYNDKDPLDPGEEIPEFSPLLIATALLLATFSVLSLLRLRLEDRMTRAS
jgi:hypothetical protein